MSCTELSDTPGITQANKVVNFTIDNFIIKSNDIAKFSGVIMLVDEATLSIFKKRKEEVLPSLNASLKDPSIDANKTELFTEAIRVLSE